jgi:hypothetical protein
MPFTTRLQGTDLIDCARANSRQGIEIAAQRCGYGDDLATFECELQTACDSIGVEIKTFKDLIGTKKERDKGIVVAPETSTQL